MAEESISIPEAEHNRIIGKLNGKYAEMVIKNHFENKGKTYRVIPCEYWVYPKNQKTLSEAFNICNELRNSFEKQAIIKYILRIGKGVPDFLVVSQNTYYFVEAKSRGGKLEAVQIKMIKEIQERFKIPVYYGYVAGKVEPVDTIKQFDIIRIDDEFENKLRKAKAKYQQ